MCELLLSYMGGILETLQSYFSDSRTEPKDKISAGGKSGLFRGRHRYRIWTFSANNSLICVNAFDSLPNLGFPLA